MNKIKSPTFTKTCSSVIMILFMNGCQTQTEQTASNEINTLSNLNDTGIILHTQEFPFRDISNPAPSIALSLSLDTGAPGQDADKGNDASPNNSNNDGSAGFKFTKLNATGLRLVNQADSYSTEPWQCVKDEITGLTWEVKTLSGLQNTTGRYTWYETNEKINGGHSGAIGENKICDDLVNCNTSAYIDAINAMNEGKGLCNSKRWRLPLREELRSLIDYSITSGPMIDSNFFPNSAETDTWTSQTAYYRSEDGSQAWEVHFDIGKSESHDKDSTSVAVRLVY